MVESENKKGKTKGAEAFKEITDTEKFDCDVLITTKVLDNGINFSDPKLKHIAIDDMNMTEIKQMIGRRRILSEDGKIHVYFRDISEGSLRNYVRFNIYEKICLINTAMEKIDSWSSARRQHLLFCAVFVNMRQTDYRANSKKTRRIYVKNHQTYKIVAVIISTHPSGIAVFSYNSGLK